MYRLTLNSFAEFLSDLADPKKAHRKVKNFRSETEVRSIINGLVRFAQETDPETANNLFETKQPKGFEDRRDHWDANGNPLPKPGDLNWNRVLALGELVYQDRNRPGQLGNLCSDVTSTSFIYGQSIAYLLSLLYEGKGQTGLTGKLAEYSASFRKDRMFNLCRHKLDEHDPVQLCFDVSYYGPDSEHIFIHIGELNFGEMMWQGQEKEQETQGPSVQTENVGKFAKLMLGLETEIKKDERQLSEEMEKLIRLEAKAKMTSERIHSLSHSIEQKKAQFAKGANRLEIGEKVSKLMDKKNVDEVEKFTNVLDSAFPTDPDYESDDNQGENEKVQSKATTSKGKRKRPKIDPKDLVKTVISDNEDLVSLASLSSSLISKLCELDEEEKGNSIPNKKQRNKEKVSGDEENKIHDDGGKLTGNEVRAHFSRPPPPTPNDIIIQNVIEPIDEAKTEPESNNDSWVNSTESVEI